MKKDHVYFIHAVVVPDLEDVVVIDDGSHICHALKGFDLFNKCVVEIDRSRAEKIDPDLRRCCIAFTESTAHNILFCAMSICHWRDPYVRRVAMMKARGYLTQLMQSYPPMLVDPNQPVEIVVHVYGDPKRWKRPLRHIVNEWIKQDAERQAQAKIRWEKIESKVRAAFAEVNLIDVSLTNTIHGKIDDLTEEQLLLVLEDSFGIGMPVIIKEFTVGDLVKFIMKSDYKTRMDDTQKMDVL